MKKKVILSIVCSISWILIYAQNNLETFTIPSGQKLIEVSVPNLVSMYSASFNNWETTMKSLGGGGRQTKNGGIVYMIGSTASGGIQVISKYPDAVSIMWLHSTSKTTIMDNILDDLQPHYIRREQEYMVYGFKIGDYSFKVSLKREEGNEMIIFEKI